MEGGQGCSSVQKPQVQLPVPEMSGIKLPTVLQHLFLLFLLLIGSIEHAPFNSTVDMWGSVFFLSSMIFLGN